MQQPSTEHDRNTHPSPSGYYPETGQLMCIHFVTALLRLLMFPLVTINVAPYRALQILPLVVIKVAGTTLVVFNMMLGGEATEGGEHHGRVRVTLRTDAELERPP